MSFPSKVQSITIAKTGDFDVIEKTEQPFPEQAPGHIILKVCPVLPLDHQFFSWVLGQICRCQLHRHLFPKGIIPCG